MSTDLEWMALAIEEGKKGLGFVEPNPPVGCVIISKNGTLLSKGHHEVYGESHAEVNALEGVNESSLDGATVFVTLEPCAHEGKTPSCAKRLAALPVARVVYALKDPNPKVDGQGVTILKEAGKAVELLSESSAAAESLAEKFLVNQKRSRPFVGLKTASSLDGQIFDCDGKSQWITSASSRDYVHKLRGQYDSVLVGVETFLKDNPSLNSRSEYYSDKTISSIVIDPNGRGLQSLPSSNISKIRSRESIFWVVGESCEFDSDLATIIKVPMVEGALDLNSCLKRLFKEKVSSVLVEGGRKTLGEFINQNVADRIYSFIAPIVLGNSDAHWGRSITGLSLKNPIELKSPETLQVGKDVLITGTL